MANVITVEEIISMGTQQWVTLGNSGKDDAALCADFLNQAGRRSWGVIAEDCFLGYATIKRVAEEGGSDGYGPQYDTIKRIKAYFRIQSINIVVERITPKHQNRPKE